MQERQLSPVEQNIKQFNKFITSVLKDTDLVPVVDCYLKNRIGRYNCTVMRNAHLDLQSGIILGYLRLNEIGRESDIIVFSTYCDSGETPVTKEDPNIYHTYIDTSKRSFLELNVKGFTFYNVVLNRFKSYRDIYRFAAKASVSDINELESILNKGGSNGEKYLRALERGS